MLRPNKGLRALSLTCRWIREASTPILFRSCYQMLGPIPWIGATYRILPSTLWSHVRLVDHPSLMDDAHIGRCRILRLSCCCPVDLFQDPPIVGPLVCDAFDAIHAVLPALSRLTTLHLLGRYVDVHGISWNTMRTILSLSNLRDLHIYRLYICPKLLHGDNLDDSAIITPLATFHYTLPHYRQPWSFASELIVLDFLVRKLHTSLKTLVLPVESAPIQTISSLQWPRLQEFTLQGERCFDPATPIVTLFPSMTSLRLLALKMSEPKNALPGVVWPNGLSVTFPWPNLETLRLSHPDPADEIFIHFPPSIRTLSLRSWPHECIRIYHEKHPLLSFSSWTQGREDRWWNCPLLTPHNLARVLQKCKLSLLHNLELEYRVDTHESELLCTLAVRLPHLTTLEVHRFRGEGSHNVSVVSWYASYIPSHN